MRQRMIPLKSSCPCSVQFLHYSGSVCISCFPRQALQTKLLEHLQIRYSRLDARKVDKLLDLEHPEIAFMHHSTRP